MIDDEKVARLVLQERLIDEGGLDEARRQQRRHGGDLYGVLIENGFVDEERTITAVAQVLNIPCVSLREFEPESQTTALLPVALAARHRLIALGVSREQDPPALYLAMSNPIDMIALDEIGQATGMDVVGFLAGPLDIDRTLERCYGHAIYQHQVQSLEGLLGDNSAGLRDPFAGPSVSQLLDLPMLEGIGVFEGGAARRGAPAPFGSDEEGSEVSSKKGSSTNLDVPPMLIHAPAPILDSVDLASLEVFDEMLEVDLEGFGDVQDVDLFGVRGSRIFMSPESLTEAGRQRLMEVSQASISAQNKAGNATVIGPFKTLETPEAAAIAKAQRAQAAFKSGVSAARRSASSDETVSADDNLSQLPFPRELTGRSVRLLNQVVLEASAEDVLASTPPEALLRAAIRALIKRELLTEAELLQELSQATKADPPGEGPKSRPIAIGKMTPVSKVSTPGAGASARKRGDP